MEERSAMQVELERKQVDQLVRSTNQAQYALRRSIGRALAFVAPGLGHAFHGAVGWALAYAAAFSFALWRIWDALTSPINPLRNSGEAPIPTGWLLVAAGIWIGQFLHVCYMEIND